MDISTAIDKQAGVVRLSCGCVIDPPDRGAPLRVLAGCAEMRPALAQHEETQAAASIAKYGQPGETGTSLLNSAEEFLFYTEGVGRSNRSEGTGLSHGRSGQRQPRA